MSALQYAVVEIEADGTVRTWGPFSEARADAAVEAIQGAFQTDVSAHVLWPPTLLSEALPDWRRVA